MQVYSFKKLRQSNFATNKYEKHRELNLKMESTYYFVQKNINEIASFEFCQEK